MDFKLQTPSGTASSEQLVTLAKGFSKIFWGIPVALLLFAGAITINFLPGMRLPSYVFGVLLIYWGMVLLFRGGAVTEKWSRLVKFALLCVFAQIYLAPFIHWWKKLPHHTYFTIHMFALVFFISCTMFLIAKIAGQLANSISDEWFALESKICGWVTILLIFAPLMIYFTFSLHASVRHSTSLYLEVSQVHYALPDYIKGLLLMPFALTMALAWKAKERCYQCLNHQMSELENLKKAEGVGKAGELGPGGV